MKQQQPERGSLVVRVSTGEGPRKTKNFGCSLKVAQAHAKAHQEAQANLHDVIELMATWICREDPPEPEPRQEKAA